MRDKAFQHAQYPLMAPELTRPPPLMTEPEPAQPMVLAEPPPATGLPAIRGTMIQTTTTTEHHDPLSPPGPIGDALGTGIMPKGTV